MAQETQTPEDREAELARREAALAAREAQLAQAAGRIGRRRRPILSRAKSACWTTATRTL